MIYEHSMSKKSNTIFQNVSRKLESIPNYVVKSSTYLSYVVYNNNNGGQNILKYLRPLNGLFFKSLKKLYYFKIYNFF